MDEKLKEILNLVLEHFPYYGDFKLIEKLSSINNEKFKIVFTKISNPQVQALQLTEYLVNNGFAIKRGDKSSDGSAIELTERGRWLKEKGSFEAYLRYQDEKRENKKLQNIEILGYQKRSIQMNRLTIWIAISTVIAAFYYLCEILNHIFGFYCY